MKVIIELPYPLLDPREVGSVTPEYTFEIKNMKLVAVRVVGK